MVDTSNVTGVVRASVDVTTVGVETIVSAVGVDVTVEVGPGTETVEPTAGT